MGGLANPMSIFGGDRKAAGGRGQQAAVVAGLPSTQIAAVRNGAMQDYGIQSQMQQEMAARAQAQAQAQGLGGILQMLAYMHARNPHAQHSMSMATPDGTKIQLNHKPPTFDQFGGGNGAAEEGGGQQMGQAAPVTFANYHNEVANPKLDGSNLSQLVHLIMLHKRLKALSGQTPGVSDYNRPFTRTNGAGQLPFAPNNSMALGGFYGDPGQVNGGY